MFEQILSMLFDYVDFIVNLFMIIASWFLLLDLVYSFSMNVVWMFKLYLIDTHFGFLLMPKGERNGIKSRTYMSNQLNFKIGINSKTKGENLCE